MTYDVYPQFSRSGKRLPKPTTWRSVHLNGGMYVLAVSGDQVFGSMAVLDVEFSTDGILLTGYEGTETRRFYQEWWCKQSTE